MIEHIIETDFDRLFEIEQQAHIIPWSKGTLLNNQGERYLNLKLLEQGKIVGFVICNVVLDEATLFNIAVDPAEQGRGYGKALLQGLITELSQKDVITLWLEVRESNIKAQQLYTQLGFNEVTVRKHYYPLPDGKKENAIVMALYL